MAGQVNSTIKAAAYCRVSSAAQATPDKASLETQEDAARKIAASRGWQFTEAYIEAGVSGEIDPENRPAYARLLQAAAAGKFNVLIIRDAKRLARNHGDYIRQVDKLEVGFGIQILDLEDQGPIVPPEEYRPRRDNSRVIKNAIKGMYGELDNNNRVALFTAAKAAETRKGRHVSGPVPYGYIAKYGDTKRRELEPDPTTYHYLGLIKQMALEDKLSFREIAGRLQAMNAFKPDRNRKNGVTVWYASTIHTLLNNPFYAGRVTQGYRTRPGGKNDKRVKNPNPSAVIWGQHNYPHPWTWAERETMLEIAANRSQRYQAPRTHRSNNPLSGLVRCAYCDMAMSVGTNKAIYYLRCNRFTLNKQLCTNSPIPLEKLLRQRIWPDLDKMARNVSQGDYSDVVSQGQGGNTTGRLREVEAAIQAATKDLEAFPKRKERIDKAYQLEAIDINDYRQQVKGLQVERGEVEARVKALEKEHDRLKAISANMEAVESFAETWKMIRSQLDKPLRQWPDGLAREVRAVLSGLFGSIKVRPIHVPYDQYWDFEVKYEPLKVSVLVQ